MDAKDLAAFKKDMILEADAHTDNEHWEVRERGDVPSDQGTPPSSVRAGSSIFGAVLDPPTSVSSEWFKLACVST